MKTKIFPSVLALALMVSAFGQKPTFELTFTAINNYSYVQLDSVKVMNRTQGCDTVLYWPDTILVLDFQGGINEIKNGGENLRVFQNYPNPVKDQTTITLYIPEKDKTGVMISDILGRQVINTERMLDKGYHSFRFTPGSGKIFFFTAYWKASSSSIKILTSRNISGLTSSLEYTGTKIEESQFKRIEATQNFSFSLGNTMLYIGYVDTLQSGMLDAPETSETFTLQFSYNIPCPKTPFIFYEGQYYYTVQIFNQCWLNENLNVGIMIDGSQNQQDNGTIEKYCYDDAPAYCDTYGGLYQWDEMMQYIFTEGTQGICPDGWHIPSDEEWKVLEGTVDNQYGVGDPEWNQPGHRGFDAGLNLKSTSDWVGGGNGTDMFGFSGLPGGYRLYDYGSFLQIGVYGNWWSTTENIWKASNAWLRLLMDDRDSGARAHYVKTSGFSVRCVMDY